MTVDDMPEPIRSRLIASRDECIAGPVNVMVFRNETGKNLCALSHRTGTGARIACSDAAFFSLAPDVVTEDKQRVVAARPGMIASFSGPLASLDLVG